MCRHAKKKAWGETSGYQQYILERNRGKYQLFIDTGTRTPDETAEMITAFIAGLTEGRSLRRYAAAEVAARHFTHNRNELTEGCMDQHIIRTKWRIKNDEA